MSNTLTRVGTANMYDNALRNLGERHSSLVGLQDNLTAGKRVVRPSDDPVAAAQAAIQEVADFGGHGGLVAVDTSGNIAMPFASSGLKRAALLPDGTIVSAAF